MIEWIWVEASKISDFLALMGVIATGGLWVVKMLLAGKKQVEGLIAGQQALAKAFTEIEAQLKPNGGSSVFDKLKSAADTSAANAERLSSIVETVSSIRAYQWNFAEALSDRPIWESDADGNCIRVNGPYTKLAERNSAELTGGGWENFVLPDDRARVFAEWSDAIRRHRTFESTFRVRGAVSGKISKVKCVAIPVTTDGGKVLSYIGRYDEIVPA